MVTAPRRSFVLPGNGTKQKPCSPRFTRSVEAAADLQAPARDWPALVAAGITVVLWASAFVGIRSAGRTFSPGALSLGRLSVAVAALAIIGVVRGERLPTRAALKEVGRPLLVCGAPLVRRLQRRAQLGRATRGRRDLG